MSRADQLAAAIGELGMKDVDELYEKIGLGERLAPLVARRLLPAVPTEEGAVATAGCRLGSPAPRGLAGRATPAAASRSRTIRSSRSSSSGRGVVIHRENCVNVEDYRKHPEKWLPGDVAGCAGPLLRSEVTCRSGEPHRRSRCRCRCDFQH